MKRTGARRSTPGGEPARVPVVVSLDADGAVLDIVGELSRFVSASSSEDAVLQSLRDLAETAGELTEIVSCVELSDGRFADLHILRENDVRHIVVMDVSHLMEALRRRQQVDNEAALLERFQRAELDRYRATQPPRGHEDLPGAVRGGSELFATLLHELRTPVSSLSGSLLKLAPLCRDNAAAARVLAELQQEVNRLDTFVYNGLGVLGRWALQETAADRVDLARLAERVQDAFALQTFGQSIALEVHAPEVTATGVDASRLWHVLLNLLVHALDDAQYERLILRFIARGKSLEIELACEPGGFASDKFGRLVTAPDARHYGASAGLALPAAHRLIELMDGTAEIIPLREGGHELLLRIPAGFA